MYKAVIQVLALILTFRAILMLEWHAQEAFFSAWASINTNTTTAHYADLKKKKEKKIGFQEIMGNKYIL